MPAKKNSLVANLNRRKEAGTSRPKSKGTVDKKSYAKMEAGWPEKGGKKKAAAKKSAGGAKKAPAKKAPAKKPVAKKTAAKKKSS